MNTLVRSRSSFREFGYGDYKLLRERGEREMISNFCLIKPKEREGASVYKCQIINALSRKIFFSKESFKGFGYGLSKIINRERERERLYMEILAKESLAQQLTVFI